MKVLVANLGSTSFKYRLIDVAADKQLARGGIDRIGQPQSQCYVEIGSHSDRLECQVADHAAAVGICLDQLTDPQTGCLKSAGELSAIGFKAVFAGMLSGVRLVNDDLLSAMEEFGDVAPAHNPPYCRAMRQLRSAFPEIPLVAALETGFHQTVPAENCAYAIPYSWQEEHGIKRWGFHGASHRYIAERIAAILGRKDLRVVSCHLGGSASLCAIRDGKSVANSLGMSPQSGLPHNNRVGDFDPFALPVIMRATGQNLEQVLDDLANRSGLLGLSGISGDVRDLEQAAAQGDDRAKLAIGVFVSSIRQYLGGYLALLGGADVIVFTGGIGENSTTIREAVCRDMEWAGIQLDKNLNQSASGEASISETGSKVAVWVVPTNEEIIVARQTAEVIAART